MSDNAHVEDVTAANPYAQAQYIDLPAIPLSLKASEHETDFSFYSADAIHKFKAIR